MKCHRCNKEMINTIGGNYHCPNCKDVAVNDLVLRTYDAPPKETANLEGWICPLCGTALSPWTNSCPCNNKVTC